MLACFVAKDYQVVLIAAPHTNGSPIFVDMCLKRNPGETVWTVVVENIEFGYFSYTTYSWMVVLFTYHDLVLNAFGLPFLHLQNNKMISPVSHFIMLQPNIY